MNSELQKKLFEEFPKLFLQKDLPMTQTAMCWGISCGDGWFDILRDACLKIESHFDNLKSNGANVLEITVENTDVEGEDIIWYPQFTQVKEKFGSLRVYYVGGDDEVFSIVDALEDLSSETCELCGNKGRESEGYWISVRCEDCDGK